MPYDNILQNVIPHLVALWTILRSGFVVVGFGLIIWSLWRMAHPSRDRGFGLVWPVLAVGALFINLPSFLDTMSQTLLGQNSTQTLSYMPPASNAQSYVQFAVFLAAIAGLIGLGRGLWLLKDATKNQGSLARGLVHIFGGVICVNLVETIRLVAGALGGDLPEAVKAIFG
ncbi:MAG: hypothetical protein LBS60_02115 [Deltaproteobacteria bacterium]|jgi:hypothetical protein|nr:hypothetical protein [Deltaproteobacteria bacterium]